MQAQVKNITEQFEDIVGTVRNRIVETNEYVADTVSPYLAKVEVPNFDLPKMDLPKIDVPFADRLPKLPEMSELPSASAIVDRTFGFVSDGVEANRKFVSELVGAWTNEDAPKKAATTAKSAASTATKKTTATAKKTAATAKKTTTAAAKKASSTAAKATK